MVLGFTHIFMVNPKEHISRNPFMHNPRRSVFGHNFGVLVQYFLRICWQPTKSDHKMNLTEKINDRLNYGHQNQVCTWRFCGEKIRRVYKR